MPTKQAVALVVLLLSATPLFAGNHNDDSCDITVTPAATLLLPFFEVDIASPHGIGVTTLFTVINTSAVDQIAHITIWSDWAYPVLAFNIFLTGYDVQSIDLYDVLVRGVVAPPRGTSSFDKSISPQPATGAEGAIPGELSNANLASGIHGVCAALPPSLPAGLLASVQETLTVGFVPSCPRSQPVGGVHTSATGYLTIDVVSTCSSRYPDDPAYIAREILFDNVLTGDYQRIWGNFSSGNFVSGNPMVHLRAIPEGGHAGSRPGTNLPYTFYDRYTKGLASRTFDRRQPLPSVFAVRWFEGGTGGFNSHFTIWREGASTAQQACANAQSNSTLVIRRAIRFDERESSVTHVCPNLCPGCCPPPPRTSASQRATTMDTTLFPPNPFFEYSGWMYLDLNHGAFAGRPSQAWVTVTMDSTGRFSFELDAAALGNGCSPVAQTERVGPLP